MTTIRLRSSFDLALTLTSGQVFYWGNFEEGKFNFAKPDGRGFWWGVSRNLVWILKQEGNKIILQKGDYNLFFELFGISDRIEDLYELAKRYADTHLIRALESFRGLRMMRQDPWETLVSFILSAQNRVENIAKAVWMLSKEYGEFEDGIPKIPKPEALKDADYRFLETLPMKYKAQALRLKETSKIISNDPEFWKRLPEDYYERRKYLMKLPGVGKKIADCVLAYGLGDGRAVPVDTHILRISKELYKIEGSYDEIGEFYRRRYGEYAALAQLYLYALSRTPNVLRNKTAL